MRHQTETKLFIGLTTLVLLFLLWNILFQDNEYYYETDDEYIEFHNQYYQDSFENEKFLNNGLLKVSNKKAKVTSNKKELECLALNIYHEARNQSRIGKLMVGHVTLNRVKSDLYPNTICEVVYQPRQFSWTHQLKNKTPKDKESWNESLSIARLVMNRTFDRAKGATHYLNPKKVNNTPNWAKPKSKTHKKITVVEDHHFFKPIKKPS